MVNAVSSSFHPFIGIFVIAAWGAPSLFEAWGPGGDSMLTAAMVVARKQIRYWESDLALRKRTVQAKRGTTSFPECACVRLWQFTATVSKPWLGTRRLGALFLALPKRSTAWALSFLSEDGLQRRCIRKAISIQPSPWLQGKGAEARGSLGND